MPVWNGAKTLSATLRSLLQQDYSNWELLLMDDGSTDSTLKVASALSDSRIRLISDSQRKGLAAQLNQAIDASRGKYFARLDADDTGFPNRLSVQVAFLEANPAVDLVGSAGMVFGNKGEPIGLLPVRGTHEEICCRPWSGFYLGHPTWMGNMSWFRKHRYNSAAIKAQDYDLLLRTYKTSRFPGLEQVLIGYRQDRISVRKRIESRYHVSRSLVRSKHHVGLANLIRGLFGQFAKSTVDVFALSTGLDRRILNHRAKPLPPRQEFEPMERSLGKLSSYTFG
jgi:glycosyltransferase involved in cell wall biosynthesis